MEELLEELFEELLEELFEELLDELFEELLDELFEELLVLINTEEMRPAFTSDALAVTIDVKDFTSSISNLASLTPLGLS